MIKYLKINTEIHKMKRDLLKVGQARLKKIKIKSYFRNQMVSHWECDLCVPHGKGIVFKKVFIGFITWFRKHCTKKIKLFKERTIDASGPIKLSDGL